METIADTAALAAGPATARKRPLEDSEIATSTAILAVAENNDVENDNDDLDLADTTLDDVMVSPVLKKPRADDAGLLVTATTVEEVEDEDDEAEVSKGQGQAVDDDDDDDEGLAPPMASTDEEDFAGGGHEGADDDDEDEGDEDADQPAPARSDNEIDIVTVDDEDEEEEDWDDDEEFGTVRATVEDEDNEDDDQHDDEDTADEGDDDHEQEELLSPLQRRRMEQNKLEARQLLQQLDHPARSKLVLTALEKYGEDLFNGHETARDGILVDACAHDAMLGLMKEAIRVRSLYLGGTEDAPLEVDDDEVEGGDQEDEDELPTIPQAHRHDADDDGDEEGEEGDEDPAGSEINLLSEEETDENAGTRPQDDENEMDDMDSDGDNSLEGLAVGVETGDDGAADDQELAEDVVAS